MKTNVNKSEKFSHQKEEATQMAVDGLLMEFARNSSEYDLKFVEKIVKTAASEKPSTKRYRAKIFLGIIGNVMAVAAGLLLMSGLVYYFSSGDNLKPSDDNGENQPCILVSSPGGIIKSANRETAIANGMRIKCADVVRIFSSNSAFVQFPDLSRMELGAGSTVAFNDIGKKTAVSRKYAQNEKKIFLQKGVINVDIVRRSDGGIVTVSTDAGEFMTGDAKFILIQSDDLCYLEVKRGIVKVRENGKESVQNISSGQNSIFTAVMREKLFADNDITERISECKAKLTMGDKGFENLLFQLVKKKKADICLRDQLKRETRGF